MLRLKNESVNFESTRLRLNLPDHGHYLPKILTSLGIAALGKSKSNKPTGTGTQSANSHHFGQIQLPVA
jgi:hypothetical protein